MLNNWVYNKSQQWLISMYGTYISKTKRVIFQYNQNKFIHTLSSFDGTSTHIDFI